MKNFNLFRFVSDAALDLADHKNLIETAESYEIARSRAYEMRGYLTCLVAFLNNAMRNMKQDEPGEFSDFIHSWEAEMYEALAHQARKFEQPSEVEARMLEERDNCRACCDD